MKAFVAIYGVVGLTLLASIGYCYIFEASPLVASRLLTVVGILGIIGMLVALSLPDKSRRP